MSETDSFIEEVTEEVRRDKLFALMRKYGWIAILAVILIVGGAAWNEWRKARDRAAAEALGDAVLSALEAPESAAQARALAEIDAARPESALVLALLRAAAEAQADNREAALSILDGIASDPEAPVAYRDLAILKAVILRGADQDRDERLAKLDALAVPGRPFRVLALEQKALALYEFGDNDGAIAILLEILDEPEATEGLLQRAQQLIVALGGTLPGAEASGGGDDG